MIEDVECVDVVAQRESLIQLKILERAKIETLLEWAPEDIATSAGISILKIVAGICHRIARWHAVRTRRVGSGDAEGSRIQDGKVSIHTGRALQDGILCGSPEAANRNDRICNQILSSAPVNAGRATAVIDHAVGLSTLQNDNSVYSPTIGYLLHESVPVR